MGINNSKNKIYPIVFKKDILNKDNECSICLKKFKNDNITLPCNHNYHEKCITLWLNEKMNCPLCRTNISFVKN